VSGLRQSAGAGSSQSCQAWLRLYRHGRRFVSRRHLIDVLLDELKTRAWKTRDWKTWHQCLTSLAFSTPAVWCRVFQSRVFWPCIFDRRALSSLAFSVPRPFYSLLALPHSMRSRVYVTVGRPSVRPSVRLPLCPIVRQPVRRVAGLLLSAVRAGDVDRQRRAPAPSSSGAAARAAARRSAANAGSVMSTAELTRLTQTCQLYNKGAYMSIIRLTSVILCNFSFFLQFLA